MEFLRFGSSIPGSYWGCCACDIIQNFHHDPDERAAIQLVTGDGGGPIVRGGEMIFAGPTYRDIFHQRIRVGTFDTRDMPNHAFLAIITASQIQGSQGKKWLAILKEAGFEFIRSVSNSVYGGQSVLTALPKRGGSSLNHIFGLFRNIGSGAAADPYIPPKAWTDLPAVVPEAWESLKDGCGDTARLASASFENQRAVWDKIGKAEFLPKSKIPDGTPIWLAGQRSQYPQQLESVREMSREVNSKKAESKAGKTCDIAKAPAPVYPRLWHG